MGRNALRRAAGACVVLVTAALLLGNGVVGSTFALFNGETTNASSAFAGGWVDAPTAATATPSGYDMNLAWTAGTHGPVTGQNVNGVDNGTSSNCTGAAYALISAQTAAATSYSDASRANAGNNGDWFCYQLVSTSATVWTSPLALAAAQIGLVTSGVSIANAGGTAGTMQTGDTITLTFNQRTTIPAGTIKVCAFTATKTILLDDQKNGNTCGTAAADGYGIAQLTTAATISADTKFTATVTVTTTAPYTATITLGAGTSVTIGASPTWSATPAGTILSFITTHQATMCTAATTNCKPTTTSTF